MSRPVEIQNDLEKKTEWQQILALGERLLNAGSLTKQRKSIIETAQDLLHGQVELWIDLNVFSIPAAELKSAGTRSNYMKLACYEKRAVQAVIHRKNIKSEANASIQENDQKGYVLAAPLIFNQETLGAISIKRKQGSEFTEHEIALLEGLASQSAMTLHATHQISIDQRRFELLALVRSVSAQIADIIDLDELARRIANLVLVTFRYYYVGIFTIEPGQEYLRFRGSAIAHNDRISKNPRGQSETAHEAKERPPVLSVKIGEGIIGSVAQSGQEIIANDASLNPHFRAMDVLPGTRSEVALPLRIEERILGVLDVQSDQQNAFDETDMLVLGALADNIATAVENARLYGDVRKRADQITSIARVSNAITSILNLDDLLNEVVRLLHQHIQNSQIHIFIVHTVRKQILYQAGDESSHLSGKGLALAVNWDDTDQVISWVVNKGETAIITDTIQDSRFKPWNQYNPDIRSEIAVPLIFGNDVLGVLDLQSKAPDIFRADEQFLLETFADNLAIAIRNASLYRSEQWRRQVADSMREVAVLLTADADLEQVLDLILQELHRTLPCDYAAIWLKDTVDNQEITGALYLAAVHTSPLLQERYSSEEQTIDLTLIQNCTPPSAENAWLLQAFNAEFPLIRTPDMSFDPLADYLSFPEDYSAIAAPLRVADHPLGVLALGHYTPGRYGSESQIMTATFASYAAVSIENTRLYEAAHDQAWVSTVLLEVAEAIQSLDTMEELLATMVRITPMLIGLNSCAIFLWDNSEEIFVPAAAHGLEEDELQLFQLWQTALGDDPAFDQLYFSRKPVFLEFDTQRVGSMHNLIYQKYRDGKAQSVVMFPMAAHGEVMGTLVIAHHLSQSVTSNGRSQENVELEDKFAIVQGIAQQTAVAIENIQLLKSQKEEAYVSVALLQVAQAIVSLNALDEILEAIVRITPILIGVKRSAIFLWNSDGGYYRLSRTYGISKLELNDLQLTYYTEEFLLLDAVRLSNNLAYHVYSDDTDAPNNWPMLTDDAFHLVGLENPNDGGAGSQQLTSGNRDYLRSQGSLLYAYPLSVKGVVLGVMLTQEMSGTGTPSFHIRERRQEISIGITQQAALAIQNDLLQSEVVERERLEKEMQLAREIQQTFLPDSLPAPIGWELDARWEPAREVGGDFYDVLELPDNQLGIVIADVADKGMPAALYMTLIRTLIRATAREELSPARVLKRVNDLLVNDSKKGMFVTVAYAVVSLQSGQVAYANGGHNYPFILRKSRELERLPTTGMALGILADTQFDQKIYELQSEDCLIFYTDGVTEAFSLENTMFSEKRLQDTIKMSANMKASDLLENIEKAVRDFTAGAPVSDDLTLLAIKRGTFTGGEYRL